MLFYVHPQMTIYCALSHLFSFSFSRKNFLQQSLYCRSAGCITSQLLLMWKTCPLPLFINEVLIEVFFFSFQHFKNLLYNSDVSYLWWQVSHHLFTAPLQIIGLVFSLSAFKLFVLSLVFSSLDILCLGSVLFLFILRIHVFLVCLSWYCPPNLRNFLSLRLLFFQF